MKNFPRKQKKYEIIEHTADIGLRSFGTTMPELFCHAAQGMFSLIGNVRSEVRLPRQSMRIKVAAANQEELLIAWLSELLSLSDARGIMLSAVSINTMGETGLIADGFFVLADPAAIDFIHEIKAVTYHRVKIEAKDGRLQAEVFFDL